MIKVIARNIVKQNKINEVLDLYKELVEKTRMEKGCLKYELFQDINNPSILTMIEEWEDNEALEEHFIKEHFVRIVPQVKNYLSKETDFNIYSILY